MHSKSLSRISLASLALLLGVAFAAPSLAIPICGDGFCDRNNFVLPETIYNCPEDCCTGFAPADEVLGDYLDTLFQAEMSWSSLPAAGTPAPPAQAVSSPEPTSVQEASLPAASDDISCTASAGSACQDHDGLDSDSSD